MTDRAPQVEQLLASARSGSLCDLGEALEACRGYLLAIAQRELEPTLQPKRGASDLVQDTFLKAHLHFEGFRGTAAADLRAWLRELLLNNLRDFRRLYADTAKRQVHREVSLDRGASEERSVVPATRLPSPSTLASNREDADRLDQVLGRLPDDHRQVLELRYRQEMSFDEIARHMDRTPNAVRKLWSRALQRLQAEWGGAR